MARTATAQVATHWGLSEADCEFAHMIHFQKMEYTKAYRICFPERCVSKTRTGKDKTRTANQIKDSAKSKHAGQKMQAYLAYLSEPPAAVLERIETQLLHTGSLSERAKVAEKIRARQAEESTVNAADRYVEILRDVGARITVPVMPNQRTVVVSLSDVLEGRARMSLPKAGMLELLRRAGAPWNEKAPNSGISDLQIEMLARDEKICVLEGGTGCGKSVLGGMKALATLALPNKKIGILGSTYDHAGSEFQYVYEGFLKLFGPECATRIAYKNHRTFHDMEIYTIWNSTLIAHSLDRDSGSQMYGKEFDLVILAEASRINADAWWRAVYRGLQRRAMRMKICDCAECENPEHYWTPETGYALLATTPDGYEGASRSVVDHIMEITKQKPADAHYEKVGFQNSFYFRNADCLENPAYDPEAFEAAVTHLPEDIVNEQYRGLAQARSGLIYQEYDQYRHNKPMPGPERLMRMRLGIGGDTAKHAAFLLLGIEPDLTKWVLGEVFNIAATTRENSMAIKEMIIRFFADQVGMKFDIDGVSDAAIDEIFEPLIDRVEIWNFDSACQSKEDYLENLQVPLTFEKPEVQGSIDLCRTWLKNDALYVATVDGEVVAPNLVWEMNKHKWVIVKESRSGDVRPQLRPEKKNNHSCDGLRYGLIELHKAGPVVVDDHEPLSLEEAYRNRFERPLLDWRSGIPKPKNMGDVVRGYLH
jgi:hypothetical protein